MAKNRHVTKSRSVIRKRKPNIKITNNSLLSIPDFDLDQMLELKKNINTLFNSYEKELGKKYLFLFK